MTTAVSSVGFVYVNGVANTVESLSTTTQRIEEIIRKNRDFEPGELVVASCYNDSTPIERISVDVLGAIVGGFSMKYSFDQESKGEGSFFSRVIGLAGLGGVLGATLDFISIQTEKEKIADRLAKRVSKFLEEDERNIMNLVLHSQGSHIGYKSLKQLASYKGRINVITLGSMVTIPENLCAKVTNFKFSNDLISNYVAIPFRMPSELSDNRNRKIVQIDKKGPMAHSAEDYLKAKIVQEEILALARF